MGIFGWSLPPGTTHKMIDEVFGREEPCRVCGQMDAYMPGTRTPECVCPECPVCGEIGNPACYDGEWHCSWCGPRHDGKPCWQCKDPDFVAHGYPQSERRKYEWREPHGLIRSFAQVALLAEAERQWRAEAEAEAQNVLASIEDAEFWGEQYRIWKDTVG